jgi:hypothetical protein
MAKQNKVRNALLILFLKECHILVSYIVMFTTLQLAYWWRYLLLSVAHHFSAYVYKERPLSGSVVLPFLISPMRSVPILQWESDIFCHNQCSTGINFSTYPTGPNTGFQWDEECSLYTMRISRFPSWSVFDGYQLLNIPNWS